MLWKRKSHRIKSDPRWLLIMNEHISLLRSGDYSKIPSVFCIFAHDCNVLKTDAANALCSVLDKAAFDNLIHFDEQMRQAISMEWFINWCDYTIDDFFTTDMSVDERRAVTIFASFNPNGFIRERAVHMMKGYVGTLPFMLLRQNDWVSQVREAANETADYRLANLSEGELIAALPFADKISRSGRLQNKDLYVSRIYTTLILPENENELFAGFNSENIRTRRICTHALLSSSIPRYDLAFDRLIYESDPYLRTKIFRWLMESNQNMDDVADRFIKDKFPHNRLLAFGYICENSQDKASQIAQKLLLDKNPIIRENARCYLKTINYDMDYRVFYKSHLMDCTVSAIYGLGETGVIDDADVIDKYLSATNISVVRAAMTAVMRLSGEKYINRITDFLLDSREGIVKTAKNLIVKTTSIDYPKVMNIFHTTLYENTKQKCFSILLTAGKWQRLIFIFHVLESSRDEIAESALANLHRWIESYNRSYVTPSVAQKEQIMESIQCLGDKLPSKLQCQLLFLIK